ncbi:hypothetical protein TNCV_343821 [Trichonephila clavipes]|nr:hypothetical protein TNCV_343821 [Trichonephila clavipes]
MRWLGHLYRYANAFPNKSVAFSKIEVTRRRGRPPTHWLDDVEKHRKLLGIYQWKVIVTVRVNWRGIKDSALACKSLLSL